MKSQWECLLQNLGAWHGSFTQLSPLGEVRTDTPTIVSLEGLNQNQTIRQTIRRLATPDNDTVLEYSSLGRGVLFLETGAFSQGSVQFAPYADFGAELGLIETAESGQPGDRRVRLVQLFNAAGELSQLTLIREQRDTFPPTAGGTIQIADLLGTWEGTAVSITPDWLSPSLTPTRLHLTQPDPTHLSQTLAVEGGITLQSTATIAGDRLLFESGSQPVQVLLLPDGVTSTCPTTIQRGQPFFLEVGWLLSPTQRQRLIRRYSDRGEWVSLTLVTEQKTSSMSPA